MILRSNGRNLLFIFIIILIGCGDGKSSSKVAMKYKIDGSFADWKENSLLTKEIGAVGYGTFKKDTDIKQMYVDSDKDFLYIFLKCDEDLVSRFKHNKSSGILGYLYIDNDRNVKSGASKVDSSGNKAMLGVESLIWLAIGSMSSSTSGQENFISYNISHWDATKNIFGNYVASEMSVDDNKRIRFTADGAEIAIELKHLNLKAGQEVDLVFVEWAHNEFKRVKRLKFQLSK